MTDGRFAIDTQFIDRNRRRHAMMFQINDTRTRLQMGPLTIGLRRHAILSLICWLVCVPRGAKSKMPDRSPATEASGVPA
jgi:hypothetical protein